MAILKCDICGGTLSVDAGGKTATCEYCGAKHSIERMREKVMEIKGSVSIEGDVQVRQTGTKEDVSQWKSLLDKYMRAHDYKSALSIVNKILEAEPSDEDINKLYDALQELQYFDIRNGVLEKYNGNADRIVIPEGVTKIKYDAFRGVTCEELVIPDTVETFGTTIRAEKIWFGKKLNFGVVDVVGRIGCYCKTAIITGNCDAILPCLREVEVLEVPAGYNGNPELIHQYSQIEEIRGSEEYKKNVLQYDWIRYRQENVSHKLDFAYTCKYCIDESGKIKWDGLAGSVADIIYSPLITPIIVKKITEQRRAWSVCQYCGAEFTGIFTKTCPECHRRKDY